jgi:hypothetical protein
MRFPSLPIALIMLHAVAAPAMALADTAADYNLLVLRQHRRPGRRH